MNERVWGIVPSAGMGQRFGGTTPKQYAELNGITILEHSLRALIDTQLLSKIVVAISSADKYFANLSLADSDFFSAVIGGNTRAESVLKSLESIADSVENNDWVLVHDAARPLVQASHICELVERLRQDRVGGILAVPAKDTLKRVRESICVDTEPSNIIVESVDRETIWYAQTPQMFRFGLLFDCLSRAVADPVIAASITDEASALEVFGYDVKILEGDVSNIKITTPEDLHYAEFFLQK